MARSTLSAPHFHDEAAAFAHLEARFWPQGPICPKCGGEGYALNGVKNKKGEVRLGLKKCRACRAQFTVRIGTIFEDSHAPLHIWLQAIALIAASKKGMSANQLHRTLGVTLKTAWFMGHRIREAMKDTSGGMFGGNHGGVEADETFLGRDPDKEESGTPIHHMNRVMTLIDRDTGAARSFVMTEFTTSEVQRVLNENVAKEAYLLTDEAGQYIAPGREFTFHGSTNHTRGEYVSRDAPWVHTNTVEGYYSIFKRGMKGVYQHCSRAHLHRYCAEFDFRYSNRVKLGVGDQERAGRILDGAKGKRLTYKAADSQKDAAQA